MLTPALKSKFLFHMFNAKKVLTLLFAMALALTIWGFVIEPGLLIERREYLKTWPGPQIKIAFISDLHAGAPHINEAYIENLVGRINKHSPDIVLIGGDLVINGVVGGSPISIQSVALKLKKLNSPLGVFAVLGNHDWWNNGEEIRKTLELNGIGVLENKAKMINLSNGFNFWLVGIGDEYTDHADASLAFSDVTTSDPVILFMHDPAAIFQVKTKYFLALAGHMHGGQVYIPGIGAIVTPGKAPASWADGWIDFEMGSLFVSKGIGTSIIPVRLNAPPEFVILDLKK